MAKKSKKGSRGRKLVTVVEFAAAAAGLISLARELMQDHQARRRPDNLSDAESASGEDHGQIRPGGQDPIGSLLGKAGVVLGAAGELINLNRASPEVLRALLPIGKKRAKRIAARRPFKQVKRLKRVLPKVVYRSIKHQMTV